MAEPRNNPPRPKRRLCDERTCALNADYTVCLQSDHPGTMLAGLREMMGNADFTAHLYSREDLVGAWVPIRDEEILEELSRRVSGVPGATGHWLRMLAEDERENVVLFDRTFYPNGEVREPIAVW